MINQNWIYLGALIFFLGSVTYFVETIQGKVKPNRVTWFVWILAPSIIFFSQIKQGVGLEALLSFMAGLIPLIIFIASFVNKESYWKIEKNDVICGMLSIIGLILWQITKVGNIAIIFSIISDLFACFPTLAKSYNRPETENYWLYLGNGIFALITLLTIKNWNFETYSFPVYLFTLSIIFTLIIKFKIKKTFNL